MKAFLNPHTSMRRARRAANSLRIFEAGGVAALLAVSLVAPMGFAHAVDLTVGGDARVFAMGGAGLALTYGGGQRMNPASLAFERGPVGIAIPSIGVRTGGISATDIENLSKDGSSDAAGTILRKYATFNTKIGLDADFSIRISKFEIGTFGSVAGNLYPNNSLNAWARAGNTDSSTLPSDARADLIAGGYYSLPAVSAGTTLPVPEDSKYNYGVGLRLKYLHGVYSHYYADTEVLNGDSSTALSAPEMNGQNTLSKNGVAADVGFFALPRTGQGFSYAALINNLVNPGLTFDGTDENGNPHKYKLLATTLSGGVGWKHHSTAVAADLVDITGSADHRDLRVGAEQRFLNLLALRAGYSANDGFTVGAGIWGFGVAYGKRLPLEVTQSLKF